MIHVGIMGLGQIAHRVAKGICYAENAELYAVGSRSLEKAREFQRLYGAQKIYDSYERLLQDPQVEMVYIAGFEESVHFDITTVKGLKNKFFSGEGMFLATLSGPGKIWLQTMPFSVLADRVISLVPKN